MSRLLAILALSQVSLLAQSTTAGITGTITDATGASIPAASITVTSDATGVTRQTRSGDLGNFTISLLPPGVYQIKVVHDGFKPVNRSGVELKVNQVARLDFALEVGGMSEKVEVTADATQIESETSSLGQVIDRSKVDSLPLDGRMTFRLVQLTPGILSGVDAQGQFGDISVGTFDDINFSINGGRAGANATVIDGVPASTGFLNLFTTVPSVEATQEFKVQSNATAAEYGRFAGGVINVSTLSGSNDVHGSLFEFLRNNKLNADDFFNNRAGLATPSFHMNQFGSGGGRSGVASECV